MKILIIKLGATGDVVRTTTLLRGFEGDVTWVTSKKNEVLIAGLKVPGVNLRVVNWEERSKIEGTKFDLVINLEDDAETAKLLEVIQVGRLFGAFLTGQGEMDYTVDARRWFDLSLISRFGRDRADVLKLRNRRSYQDLIFDGLGLKFTNQRYVMPSTPPSQLCGDIAIAPEAGPVWPMKRWAYYERLKSALEAEGLVVNTLPLRPTILEHLADVRGHQVVVCGDSLPMHLGIGSNVSTVALFNCTSPWEINDYGILTKIISPRLEDFFYQRGFDSEATTSISLEDVLRATLAAVCESPEMSVSAGG